MFVVGSFPQTASVRKARSDLKAGRITEDEYHRQMETYLAHAIGVQEGLGLDVLVHGEPERSDMCVSPLILCLPAAVALRCEGACALLG